MGETSIFWSSSGTGDGGTGGYTQAQLIQWLRMAFLGDNTEEGVAKGFLNGLQVTAAGGSASPVTIDTGGGFVYGFPYWNDASGTKAIDTPTGDTRIDRIVLKANWSEQTVRIDVHEGTEGGTEPPLLQTAQTAWEIPLAKCEITTGGVITVTDERKYLNPNIEVDENMLDGDQVEINWNPSYYTPATTPSQASDVDDLSAHLYGIDQALNGKAVVDGDVLDIDWDPSNYTPDATPAEASDADDLSAHLYGIDQALATLASNDGDILDIDWDPSNYTPDVTPAQASDVDDLSAHLYGIDQALATLASNDGDILDIDWDPSNYTPDTTPAEASDVDDLSAHLYGIDQALATLASNDGDVLDVDWDPSHYSPGTAAAEASDEDDLSAHLYGIDEKIGQLVTLDLFPDLPSYAPLSGINAAGFEIGQSTTGDTHKPQYPKLTFDAGTDEGRIWNKRVSRAFGSNLKLRGQYAMGTANSSNDVVLVGKMKVVRDGMTIGTAGFASDNSLTETVPDSADEFDVFEITMSNDGGVQAGDYITIMFHRNPDAGGDNASGDFELYSLQLIGDGA